MIELHNSYADALEGLYVPWKGLRFPAPRMALFNRELAAELGLPAALDSEEGAALLSGTPPENATPLAQAYAGHQFGNFVPQLGDGRALLLGEIIGPDGLRRDLHLKGSGPTPFARGGDGRAALGPMLREYLMGEAMHALGIPTTRALAVVTTGERIRRQGLKPGAVLARIAASHLRVGTFEYAAARGNAADLRRLADYTIARHDPDLTARDDRYLALLERVIERQTRLVSRWMLVGFIHGVMNTDNMALSGETIDYGPCAFMDAHHPDTVFSSIDLRGRYAYRNQPVILQWNLARFAETLLPLIDPDPERAVRLATERIEAVPGRYRALWLEGMRAKLGLAGAEPGDRALAEALTGHLHREGVDHTLAFRHLAAAARGDAAPFRALFGPASPIDDWLARWRRRLARGPRPPEECAAAMERINPLYIPRNHKVEEALEAAENSGDLSAFRRLLSAVTQPFDPRPGYASYAEPAPPEFGPYRTFCGT